MGLVISRSLVQQPAGALWSGLGQDSLFHIVSVYPAANWQLALIRQCLELVRYMLPTALEYPSGDWNGFRVFRPARGGRSVNISVDTWLYTEYLYPQKRKLSIVRYMTANYPFRGYMACPEVNLPWQLHCFRETKLIIEGFGDTTWDFEDFLYQNEGITGCLNWSYSANHSLFIIYKIQVLSEM